MTDLSLPDLHEQQLRARMRALELPGSPLFKRLAGNPVIAKACEAPFNRTAGATELQATPTPGPWIGNASAIYGFVNGYDAMIARVCDLPCIGGHDDMAAMRALDMEKANARLIAKAPALLAFAELAQDLASQALTDPDSRERFLTEIYDKATGVMHGL